MIDPAGVPGVHDVFVCGDDAEAKRLVFKLIEDMGYVPVDLGGTETCEVMEAPRREGAVYGEEYRAADAQAVVDAQSSTDIVVVAPGVVGSRHEDHRFRDRLPEEGGEARVGLLGRIGAGERLELIPELVELVPLGDDPDPGRIVGKVDLVPIPAQFPGHDEGHEAGTGVDGKHRNCRHAERARGFDKIALFQREHLGADLPQQRGPLQEREDHREQREVLLRRANLPTGGVRRFRGRAAADADVSEHHRTRGRDRDREGQKRQSRDRTYGEGFHPHRRWRAAGDSLLRISEAGRRRPPQCPCPKGSA